MSTTERVDAVVIGGGIVGLATAHALSKRLPGGHIVVLEAAHVLAAHQSGHNSGVLHSGLYYAPGSLRAKLCVEGRRRMIEFCAANGIECRVTGKLVVATDDSEIERLDTLQERSTANGLAGVRRLGRGEWVEIEPNIVGVAALHVPEAGVVDYAEVTRVMASTLAGEVRLGSPAVGIERAGDRWTVRTPDGAVTADRLVACAGLQSDRVSRMAGFESPVHIVPFRGEYFTVGEPSASLVNHLVYPVPDPAFPFLGVHFTRRVDGSVEVGPNAVPALGRNHYRGSKPDWREFAESLRDPGFLRLASKYVRTGVAEIVRSRSKYLYGRSAQKLLPQLDTSDLTVGRAGIRAQTLRRDGSMVDDFEIVGGDGAMFVLNAPSPAATASLAIGEHLATLLVGQ